MVARDAASVRGEADSQGFSLREFIHDEAFGGVLLFACALVALIWANSPWGETYDLVWSTELTLGTVQFHLTESLRHWVNDGLMAIFFLVSVSRSSGNCWSASLRHLGKPYCQLLPLSAVRSSQQESTSCSTRELSVCRGGAYPWRRT
ncbi:MAG TPA: Na+/H+ antiporter NhaA, partial [Thermomicrobiales bacterium]|nr:Na+/H+ antiporter NhaA [Thermomicrobiales bacterium]